MKDKETKEKPDSKEKVEKELTFVTCPKHGIKYPKGSTCPKCAVESKR